MKQKKALKALSGSSRKNKLSPVKGLRSENDLSPEGAEVYRRIGVEPVINCKGTYTIIGASVEPPEVRSIMDSAYKYFVQLDELAMGIGQRYLSCQEQNGVWSLPDALQVLNM